jgi:HD-GYP domain-containing protein (c-di-GMP phosphodiesterase class II)
MGRASDLIEHSVHVAILSVLMGREQGMSRKELADLALAALVHDVGMLFLPPGALVQKRALSAREREVVESHPELGRDALLKLGGPFREIALVAWHEHERLDGSGYPQGLRGEEIEPLARLVGLADVFEALTHSRPHRLAHSPHRALRLLLEGMREAFGQELLSSLLNLITIYPLGSYVELSTKEVARVIRVERSHPLKPLVEVVYDRLGLPIHPPRLLNLRRQSALSIVRCVAGPPRKKKGGLRRDRIG